MNDPNDPDPRSPPRPGHGPPPGAPDDPASDDALAAHLDRGWAALQAGDLDAAGQAAAAARALEADSPEGVTLQGAIAAAAGKVDEALALFAQARDLDPDYVEPYLHAAELVLYEQGDPDQAIELCDAAMEIAEEEEEYLDALLLKAEAQMELGDDDDAATTLADLPPTRLPEAELEHRAGHAFLALGDLDAAERHLQAALAMAPTMTDALHALGLVHEEREDLKKMVQVWTRVREADLAEPAPPWGVSRERFEELAQEALEGLPAQLRDRLANVPVIAADYPALELVAEGHDPRTMGFFSGVPYPDKAALGAVPHLDCVFLYQRNIERACRTVGEVEDEIKKTLIHETGHFFGLSEEELEAMGLG